MQKKFYTSALTIHILILIVLVLAGCSEEFLGNGTIKLHIVNEENTVDAEFYAVYAKNLSDDTTLFEQRSFEYFYDELHWEYEASLLNVGNWEVYVYALSASVTPETDMSASVAVLRSWHQEDVVVEANSIVELNADLGGDEFSVEQKTSDLVFNFSNIEDLSPYEYFVFSGFDRFDESTTIGDGHAIARENSEFIDKTYEIPSVPGGR